MGLLFREYAETAWAIGSALKTSEKVRLVADLLRRVELDDDLYRIAVWFSHGPFPPSDPRTVNVGSELQRRAYALLVGDESSVTGSLDHEIFVACRTMTGGTIDAIEMLLEAAIRHGRTDPIESHGLSLSEVQEVYERLAVTGSTARKLEIVIGTWRRMSPLEIGFFHRTMGRGSMRIGLSSTLFEQGVALAFERPIEQVRWATMIEGDAGRTTLRAKYDELAEARMQAFRPIEFMLATPLERTLDDEGKIHFIPDPAIEIEEYLCEDKLDGIRAQIHVGRHPESLLPQVVIYSRNQGDLTGSFPDIVAQLCHLPEGTVLDGELVAVDTAGHVAHFNNLQQRLGVKKPASNHLRDYPTSFVAYDLLIADGTTILDLAIEERRALLKRLAAEHGVGLTEQRTVTGWKDLEEQFDGARARGNEGLVLKRRGSRYEYGKRGKTWLKAKKEGGSIDAVIRYAAGGTGRRSGVMSDFTFGVWLVGEDGARRLVNIGKAYGGYTNEELAELNRQLRPLRGQRFGSTWEIEPRIVCELVYDFIQPNPRAEAGYTLRFPRIRRIRWDLGVDDVDTVDDVRRLYEEGA